VTVARPNIVATCPKRKPRQCYRLTTASEEFLPILKEASGELKLGQGHMSIWVFITGITDEFILGQDALHTYDASVDLWCYMLQLGEVEVSLSMSWPSCLVVASTMQGSSDGPTCEPPWSRGWPDNS
jgi:hypothetical protein